MIYVAIDVFEVPKHGIRNQRGTSTPVIGTTEEISLGITIIICIISCLEVILTFGKRSFYYFSFFFSIFVICNITGILSI